MKRLILIDGYSLVFRAFFSNKDIENGALRGFINALVDLKKRSCSHIVVAFDTGKKTFRHDKYPGYKANRPHCPPELVPQFPLIKEVTDVLKIRRVEKNGYEADDVIATLTKKAIKDGYEVEIVAVDKDLMQLVDDSNNVTIYNSMKREIINEKSVMDKWSVTPKQLLDLLSLIGDTSDNVPGVSGIGPKYATLLINEFNTLENLLNNIDKIEKKSVKEKLQKNVDNAILSKDLITLDENVPLNETIEEFILTTHDNKELNSFRNKHNISYSNNFFENRKYNDLLTMS
jgi:DNA polymerase-1